MRANKYNFIWLILLGSGLVFGQKQTKNISESFRVNKDVLVEIDTRQSDVTVEIWNKNTVSIEGVWEVEGMTEDEATEFFKAWDFEALGNKNKVVISSGSSRNYYSHSEVFDDMDFDFDFDFDLESITQIGEIFEGNYHSELPPMPPMPPFPAPVIENLSEIEFDYQAYQKDKEAYMEKFQKKQKVWEEEFKRKYEPQMKVYEEKMRQWEKEVAPQMKAYEKKMEDWGKEFEAKFEPQMKAYEKKMEVWGKEFEDKYEPQMKELEKKMKIMEKEMGEKYAKKVKAREVKMSKKFEIKSSLLIKVPKGAVLKVDTHHGKIILPFGIKTME